VASEEIFVKHGYDLIICNTLDKPEREKAILNRMIQQRVDGIILTPTKMGTENTKLLRKVGMKMVVVDRRLPGVKDFFWVATNNYGCGYLGANYLFSKGHRNVAYINWNSGIEDLEARKHAFFDAAESYGIPQGHLVVVEGGVLCGRRMPTNPKNYSKNIPISQPSSMGSIFRLWEESNASRNREYPFPMICQS